MPLEAQSFISSHTKDSKNGIHIRVMTLKKTISLMWDGPDGMNFLMHKTKMGLIFSFVKKSPSYANCKLLLQIMCL